MAIPVSSPATAPVECVSIRFDIDEVYTEAPLTEPAFEAHAVVIIKQVVEIDNTISSDKA